MKLYKQIFATVILSAFSASIAIAAEQGIYTGAGIGLASIADSNGNSGITSDKVGMGLQDLSLSFIAGYNISKYIGIETAINALGIFGWNRTLGGSVTAFPASAEIIGYVPIFNGVDLFGKFGTSNTRLAYSTTAGQTAIDPVSAKSKTFGLGAEFSIGKMQSYRIGVDHFDLSVIPGTSVSSNYFSITGVAHF